jgi:hypothetical protein
MKILFDITFFSHKMVVAFNMFGLGMKYWVFGHFNVAHIVTKHNNWSWLDIVDFTQKFP